MFNSILCFGLYIYTYKALELCTFIHREFFLISSYSSILNVFQSILFTEIHFNFLELDSKSLFFCIDRQSHVLKHKPNTKKKLKVDSNKSMKFQDGVSRISPTHMRDHPGLLPGAPSSAVSPLSPGVPLPESHTPVLPPGFLTPERSQKC